VAAPLSAALGVSPRYEAKCRREAREQADTSLAMMAWMGTTHFLTRRLRNMRTEIALNVLAYNNKRMVALIGIRGMMESVRA